MITITQDNSSRRHGDFSRSAGPPVKRAHQMKILLVDDHFLIREAFRDLIKELRQDAIVTEAENARQAMQCVSEQADIDFVLLDLNLPDGDGFSLLRKLCACCPTLPVAVLSDEQDRNSIMKALQLGARGVIPKSRQNPILLGALRLLFAGGVFIPREFLACEVGPSRPMSLDLSDRQLEVLTLLMQGKSNKAICRTLNLAVPTVKNHVTAIMKILRASNRTEAVIAARSRGYALPMSDRANARVDDEYYRPSIA